MTKMQITPHYFTPAPETYSLLCQHITAAEALGGTWLAVSILPPSSTITTDHPRTTLYIGHGVDWLGIERGKLQFATTLPASATYKLTMRAIRSTAH